MIQVLSGDLVWIDELDVLKVNELKPNIMSWKFTPLILPLFFKIVIASF